VLAVDGLVAVLVLVAVFLLTIAGRRRYLQRGGGTVDLSLRLKTSRPGRGWVLGVGTFAAEELRWYRVFSLSPRPRRTLCRRSLEIGERRPPRGPEVYALLKGAVVLSCRSESGPVELAMERGALTGLLAWLEAEPPGRQLRTDRTS